MLLMVANDENTKIGVRRIPLWARFLPNIHKRQRALGGGGDHILSLATPLQSRPRAQFVERQIFNCTKFRHLPVDGLHSIENKQDTIAKISLTVFPNGRMSLKEA